MLESQAWIGYWRRRVCSYSRGRSVKVRCTWTTCRNALLVLKVLDSDWRVRAVVYTSIALCVQCCFSLGVMAMGVEIAHCLNGGRVLDMAVSTKHGSSSVRQECRNLSTRACMPGRGGRRREARCLPANRALLFGLISIVPARIKLSPSQTAKAPKRESRSYGSELKD